MGRSLSAGRPSAQKIPRNFFFLPSGLPSSALAVVPRPTSSRGSPLVVRCASRSRRRAPGRTPPTSRRRHRRTRASPASGVATSASPSPTPARADQLGADHVERRARRNSRRSPTGDWPENSENFLPSARNARSTASVRKLKPPRPRITFLLRVDQDRVGRRDAVAHGEADQPAIDLRPAPSASPRTSSGRRCRGRVRPAGRCASRSVPCGMTKAIRPRAVASESWIVSPRPSSWMRPLIVPGRPRLRDAIAGEQPAHRRRRQADVVADRARPLARVEHHVGRRRCRAPSRR